MWKIRGLNLELLLPSRIKRAWGPGIGLSPYTMPSGSLLTANKINKSEPSTQEQSVCVGDLPYFKTHYEDKFFSPSLWFTFHPHPRYFPSTLIPPFPLQLSIFSPNCGGAKWWCYFFIVCNLWILAELSCWGTLCIKLNPRKHDGAACQGHIICLGLMSLILKCVCKVAEVIFKLKPPEFNHDNSYSWALFCLSAF